MPPSVARPSQEEGSRPRGRWVLLLGLLLLMEGTGVLLVQAQERPGGGRDSLALIDRYRMARYRLLAQQVGKVLRKTFLLGLRMTDRARKTRPTPLGTGP